MAEQGRWVGWATWGILAFGLTALAGGCSSFGPHKLKDVGIPYNETVKRTSEEQLLLNIVRLRYMESPSSMLVSSVAAQFERTETGQLVPFWGLFGASTSSALNFRTNAAVLPGGNVVNADRPTFTLTPIDNTDFGRKLFTPLTLEGVITYAETSWTMSTALRLFTTYINGVSNADEGDGPTSKVVPVYADFLHGMALLQGLRDRHDVQVNLKERDEKIAGPFPTALVQARDVIEAAKNSQELRPDKEGKTWTLVKTTEYLTLTVNPFAIASPDMLEFERVFHLQPGLREYEISRETLTNPYPPTFPETGLLSLDLETRSLGQALFYVANGVEVPAEHIANGTALVTPDVDGRVFDWQQVLHGLFLVHCCQGHKPPPCAYVAVSFRGYWFYIDDRDFDTKATFSLLRQVLYLDTNTVNQPFTSAPLLTLPVGR